MAVAAFLLSLSCTLAPAQPGIVPHDQCDKFELQRFDNATMVEIENCATMGEALQLMGRQAWCEVVPMADVAEVAPPPVKTPPVKGPRHALNGKPLASRNSAPTELSNRDLQNQRAAGVAPPKAQFIMPNAIVPLPVKFMY